MCIKSVLRSTINCMQYVSRTLKCTVGHNCGLTPFIDVFIEEVKTRRFGVTEDVATAKDVQTQRVGEWNLVGERKPSDWIG